MEQNPNGLVAPQSDQYDQNSALNILVKAVHLGQSRGAWRLEEAEILHKAIKAFVKSEAAPSQ